MAGCAFPSSFSRWCFEFVLFLLCLGFEAQGTHQGGPSLNLEIFLRNGRGCETTNSVTPPSSGVSFAPFWDGVGAGPGFEVQATLQGVPSQGRFSRWRFELVLF